MCHVNSTEQNDLPLMSGLNQVDRSAGLDQSGGAHFVGLQRMPRFQERGIALPGKHRLVGREL